MPNTDHVLLRYIETLHAVINLDMEDAQSICWALFLVCNSSYNFFRYSIAVTEDQLITVQLGTSRSDVLIKLQACLSTQITRSLHACKLLGIMFSLYSAFTSVFFSYMNRIILGRYWTTRKKQRAVVDEVMLYCPYILSGETGRLARKKTDREREVGRNICTVMKCKQRYPPDSDFF